MKNTSCQKRKSDSLHLWSWNLVTIFLFTSSRCGPKIRFNGAPNQWQFSSQVSISEISNAPFSPPCPPLRDFFIYSNSWLPELSIHMQHASNGGETAEISSIKDQPFFAFHGRKNGFGLLRFYWSTWHVDPPGGYFFDWPVSWLSTWRPFSGRCVEFKKKFIFVL